MSGPYPPSGASPDPTSDPSPAGGNPPYGQPQYGQPQYGQPQYGQPQYGQPSPPPYPQQPYPQPQQQPTPYPQPQQPAPYPQPQQQPYPQQPTYPQPPYGQGAPNPYPPQQQPYDPYSPPPAPYPQPTSGVPQQWPPADPMSPYQGLPPQPPKQSSGALKKIASIAGALVIALIIVVIRVGLPDVFTSHNSTPTQPPPSGISATSDQKGAPTGPFVDTPAAEYPAGTAGITLPAATSVTGFSKAQVAAALEKVKKGLIAGRLDQKMLTGHDKSTLIGLLAPDARPGLEEEFTKKNFFVYATQIAPGYTLTSDPIRVKGRVTFRAATNDGIRLLEVITNFVWVYPFSGDLKKPGDHLVVVHDELTWAFPVDADVEKSSRGMWITQAEGYASNIDCDLFDQSLLALGKPIVGGGSDDPDAAFDPNSTLDIKDTC